MYKRPFKDKKKIFWFNVKLFLRRILNSKTLKWLKKIIDEIL